MTKNLFTNHVYLHFMLSYQRHETCDDATYGFMYPGTGRDWIDLHEWYQLPGHPENVVKAWFTPRLLSTAHCSLLQVCTKYKGTRNLVPGTQFSVSDSYLPVQCKHTERSDIYNHVQIWIPVHHVWTFVRQIAARPALVRVVVINPLTLSCTSAIPFYCVYVLKLADDPA